MRLALVVKSTAGSFFLELSRKFARSVAQAGVDVTLLVGIEGRTNQPNPQSIARDGFEEIQIPYASVSLHLSTGVVGYPSWVADDILFCRSVDRMLDGRYDVIQCDSPFYTSLLRRHHREQILVYNCIDGYLVKPNILPLRDRLMGKLYLAPLEVRAASAADYVVCITESIARFFRERSVGDVKLKVIPPIVSVDTELFKPADGGYADMRQKYGLAGRCTAVFVGRLFFVKGVDILLEAVRLLVKDGYGKKIRLLVVGPFSDLQAFGGGSAYANSLLRSLNDAAVREVVEFTGPMDHHELSRLLATSDIFVLPSRVEAMGVVLLEAMSSGLPLVGSRVGGIIDVVREGETGYLFEPGNPKDLAAKLKTLVDESEIRRSFGATGRKLALDKYALDIVAHQYASLYQEALSKRKH